MCNRYPDISVSTELPTGADWQRAARPYCSSPWSARAGPQLLLMASCRCTPHASLAARTRAGGSCWVTPKPTSCMPSSACRRLGASARVKLEFERGGARQGVAAAVLHV